MKADQWLARDDEGEADIALVGAPLSQRSLSPTGADRTPAAFRTELSRFWVWDGDHEVDVSQIRIRDLGDVASDINDDTAHDRLGNAVRAAHEIAPVVVVIGGDNSVTRPAMQGIAGEQLKDSWGLLTMDAHHDVRDLGDGLSNGTPVRELVLDGLVGNRIAQIGISGFSNRREFADWAQQQGFQIQRADSVHERGIGPVVEDALAGLHAVAVQNLWVDFDVDVLDRAFAPACPASMPGGLTPGDLCEAAWRLGSSEIVRGCDFTEVDATADVNGMTVRVMCAAFMSFCSGVASR